LAKEHEPAKRCGGIWFNPVASHFLARHDGVITCDGVWQSMLHPPTRLTDVSTQQTRRRLGSRSRLNELVDTINATGGVTPYYEDRALQANTPTPVADEDWVDLAAAYALACRALGLPMRRAGVEECTSSAQPTEERAHTFPAAEATAAELEALEVKARALNLISSDLDDVIQDIASRVASSINNSGLYEQIAYRVKEGCAAVDLIKLELEMAAKEKQKNGSSRDATAGVTSGPDAATMIVRARPALTLARSGWRYVRAHTGILKAR
jgi:hypothetical protein